MNKNVRDLFVIISEWHWKNTINDHLEHHVLHRGSGYFFFHLSVGNTVSLELMGFFQKKSHSFRKKKTKRNKKCRFRKSGHPKIKLFCVKSTTILCFRLSSRNVCQVSQELQYNFLNPSFSALFSLFRQPFLWYLAVLQLWNSGSEEL